MRGDGTKCFQELSEDSVSSTRRVTGV
jgi:hypothetical protein